MRTEVDETRQAGRPGKNWLDLVKKFMKYFAWRMKIEREEQAANLSRDYNCDSTTIRLRHNYDEKLTCSFFARVEWKQARDTS